MYFAAVLPWSGLGLMTLMTPDTNHRALSSHFGRDVSIRAPRAIYNLDLHIFNLSGGLKNAQVGWRITGRYHHYPQFVVRCHLSFGSKISFWPKRRGNKCPKRYKTWPQAAQRWASCHAVWKKGHWLTRWVDNILIRVLGFLETLLTQE